MIPEKKPQADQHLRIVHSVKQKTVERSTADFKARFLVRSGVNLVPMQQENVAYFCAFDKWTYLVSKDGKQYLIDTNLKMLEEQLDPKRFFRLNRRYFANIDAIQYLTPYFKGQVTVKMLPEPSEPVVVSRKRTSALKVWISD